MTDYEFLKAAAQDVYRQADEGYEVELTPELADAMGVVVEDAIDADDIDDEPLNESEVSNG